MDRRVAVVATTSVEVEINLLPAMMPLLRRQLLAKGFDSQRDAPSVVVVADVVAATVAITVVMDAGVDAEVEAVQIVTL